MLRLAEGIDQNAPVACGPDDLCRALTDLSDLSASVVLDGADEPQLRRVMDRLRTAESALAIMVAAVAERSAVLCAEGEASPPKEFLLHTGRVTGRRAGQEAARADVLDLLPDARALLVSGALGLDHLDALARKLLPLTPAQRERLCLHDLLTAAVELPADTFARHLARTVAIVETTPPPPPDPADNAGPADEGSLDEGSPDEGSLDEGFGADPGNVDGEVSPEDDAASTATLTKRDASYFRHWFDHETGMGHLSARLDPERYEALTNAIDQHTKRLASESDEPTRMNSNLAAAALVDLALQHLRPQQPGSSEGPSEPEPAGPGRRSLPHLTIVADAHGIQTGNGYPVPHETARRLLCDAIVQRVLLDDEGLPIDVGRRYRTATHAQWTAIRAVYHSCAWAGCERPLSWCQIHHIHEWSDGGATDLHNLVPLCSAHHHRVHEGKWSIRLLPNRSLVITRPNGTHDTTTDPPSRRPGGREPSVASPPGGSRTQLEN